MSNAISPTFAARTRRIRRNNRMVAKASELHIGPDGLLTVRRRRQVKGGTLLRGLIFFVFILFAAKAVMLVSVGTSAYAQSLSVLDGGNAFERAGGFIMQADSLTRFLAAGLTPLLG